MNCKELAERHAEAALSNYGRDGELSPAILLLNINQELSCSILPVLSLENGGMPGALRAVVPIFGVMFETHWVMVISETWVQHADDHPDIRKHQKGDLEKAALSGDTTVHTGLLVCAFDLFDIEASHTLTYEVEANFRRHDMPGLGEGDIADSMRWISAMVVKMLAERPDGQVPMHLVEAVIKRLADHIGAAAVNTGAVENDE